MPLKHQEAWLLCHLESSPSSYLGQAKGDRTLAQEIKKLAHENQEFFLLGAPHDSAGDLKKGLGKREKAVQV